MHTTRNDCWSQWEDYKSTDWIAKIARNNLLLSNPSIGQWDYKVSKGLRGIRRFGRPQDVENWDVRGFTDELKVEENACLKCIKWSKKEAC